jgi:hypothetical protein
MKLAPRPQFESRLPKLSNYQLERMSPAQQQWREAEEAQERQAFCDLSGVSHRHD